MDVRELLHAVETLTGPDRKADEAIARCAGYTLSIEQDQKIWYYGDPPQQVRLPGFTSSAQRALEFAKSADPGHVGALVWEEGKWSAQINENGRRCSAPTAALALCIATLEHISSRK